MKVAQNNTTYSNTSPTCPPYPSNLQNMEHFPSGSSVSKMTEAGKKFRLTPPWSLTCNTTLIHPQHCVLPCILSVFYIVYFEFIVSPPLLPVDPTTDADAPVIDYVAEDSSSLSDELPSKQSPSALPDFTYLFRTILALGIVTAVVTLVPILPHIHFCRLLYPTFILCCFSYSFTSVGPTPLSVCYA